MWLISHENIHDLVSKKLQNLLLPHYELWGGEEDDVEIVEEDDEEDDEEDVEEDDDEDDEEDVEDEVEMRLRAATKLHDSEIPSFVHFVHFDQHQMGG